MTLDLYTTSTCDVDVSLFISESMWTFSQDFKKLLLRHLATNKKPLAFSDSHKHASPCLVYCRIITINNYLIK